MYVYIILIIIIFNILFFISYLLINKNNYKNKLISYECGFSPIYYPIKPFTIKFFGVSILFLFFDIELIFLIPFSITNYLLNIKTIYLFLFFYLVVIFGLIYEWYFLILEW